jgi:hypothetical protein
MKREPTLPAAAPPVQPEEQLRYARWLGAGTRLGLVALVVLFAGYVAGLIEPFVPHERLPALWSLPVGDFLAATGTPTGWGWLRLIRHGDFANLAGIALLASVSLAALAVLLPLYARRGDRVFVAVTVLQIGVLLLAISGVLGGGH